MYEPKYAGFWSRLIAGWIDMYFISVIVFFFSFIGPWDKLSFIFHYSLALLLVLANLLLGHAFFGQTLGKYLLKIKLLRKDHAPVNFIDSSKRAFVEIIITFISISGAWIAIKQFDENEISQLHVPLFKYFFEPKLVEERLKNYQDFNSKDPFFTIKNLFLTFWFYLEMVSLLFNKQKRSIQDLIAGTIVVRKY